MPPDPEKHDTPSVTDVLSLHSIELVSRYDLRARAWHSPSTTVESQLSA